MVKEDAFKNLPEKVAEQRKMVVEQVIEDMKQGDFSWIQPWQGIAQQHNPSTGTIYRGANATSLSIISFIRGYTDPRWVTFNQAKKLGLKWRPREEIDYDGNRGCHIEKWKTYRVAKENDDPETDEEDRIYFKCVGSYTVFNACEFTNFPPMEKLEPNTDKEIGILADEVIRSSRCPISERSTDGAYYVPGRDSISVPPRDSFKSNESFLVTLLHEMGHSTSHPSACNRSISGRFGSPEYAKEELVAELSSMFSSRDLGIGGKIDTSSEHYTQHVAYLQNWMQALENDPNLLFGAASAAEKATDFIIERYEKEVGREAPGKAAIREQMFKKENEEPTTTPKQTSLSEKAKEVSQSQEQLSKDIDTPTHESAER